MTTVEKLFVQIFERKNSIIEHVKQQTELHNQYLASKLIIDGITPPSWLWSPSAYSDLNEPNKEELISKLLRPYPRPPTSCSIPHYSLHESLVITGDNEDIFAGALMENLAFDKGFSNQDQSTRRPLRSKKQSGCSLDGFPEPDVSVTSPKDQTDKRIVNIYNALDQSLAGIQRSKTRQKALELRNSEKAFDKSRMSNDNIRNDLSGKIRFSLSAKNTVGQNEEKSALPEHCIISSQNRADWNLGNADIQSKAKEKNEYSGRITRSRSNVKVLDFSQDSPGCSCENFKDDALCHISKVRRTQSISDSGKANDNVNKEDKSVGPSSVYGQNCGDKKVDDADSLPNDKSADLFAGKISRSAISSECQSHGLDSTKADIFSDDYMRKAIPMMGSRDDSTEQTVYVSPLNSINFLNEDCSFEVFKENDFPLNSEVRNMQSMHLSNSGEARRVSKDPKSAGPSTVYRQSRKYKKVDGADCLANDKITNISAAQFSRSSISSKCQGFGSDSSKADISSDERIDTVMMDSEENSPSQSVLESLLNPSNILNEGCSQEILKEDVFSSISEIRMTQSMHLSDSGDAHDCFSKEPKSAGPSIVYRQTCSDKKVDGADHLTDNKCANISSARLSRSTASRKFQSHGSDSSKGDISSDDYQQTVTEMMEFGGDNLPPQSVYGSLLNPSNILAEGCGTQESISGDSQSHRTSCAVPLYDSDQKNDFAVEASDLEIHAYTAAPDGVILVPLSGQSAQEAVDAKEENWTGERTDTSQQVSSAPGREDSRALEDKKPLALSAQGSGNFEASKNMSPLVSSTPESQNLRVSYAYISAQERIAESCRSIMSKVDTSKQICGVLETLKQFPAQQSQMCSSLESGYCGQYRHSPLRENTSVTIGTFSPCGENLSPERRFSHANVESWPQLKRRKLERQKTQYLTTGMCKLRKPHSTDGASTYFQNTETNLDAAVDTFHADRHTDVEIPPTMVSSLVVGIESAISSEKGEVEFCCKEKNEHKTSSSIINNEAFGADLVPNLRKKSANAQGYLTEDISEINSINNHFDGRDFKDGQLSQHLCNVEKNNDDLGSVDLSLTNTVLEGIQSPNWGSGLQVQPFVFSPRTEDLELIDIDQSMPVLEGFNVDAQAESGGQDLVPDGIDFEKLMLPSNSLERASILAEICRSASLDKPSTHFSWAFEFHGNGNSSQSECYDNFDLSSSLRSDVGEQLLSSKSCMEALEGMSYSDCPPCSGAHYDWSLKREHASPVGKLWERLSSHSRSSEKHLSSNPELTCFPIEEDASISEENKPVDVNAFGAQEVDSSLAKHRDKREPLKDLSNLGLNPSTSVSAHEKAPLAGRVNSLGTKLSVTGEQDKAQSDRNNQHDNWSETREKETSSIGANDVMENQPSLQGTNGIKKAKKSLSGNNSKSSLSIKSGFQGQKLSLRESKPNNIISNVSSFIPLVQQKQARTECAGKRDVKVKALEAAEAAKRLEEKKENERKRRKEALRLERAKLDEKNMRQLELEKKKKEEERKKKEAVIIAKKRQREEEEKKEKEKKRMRREARYRQRGQETMPTGKAGKNSQLSKDEKMNRKKESLHESKKQHSIEIVGGNDVDLRKEDTKSATSDIMATYEECCTLGQSCEVGKVMHAVDKSPKSEALIVNNGQGKSYDISPYQCSDDEDEEDELPTKKSIPSWASKSSVALLLPLQQQIDPDTIFPAESFCKMDEVLLPRKLQQNTVAA